MRLRHGMLDVPQVFQSLFEKRLLCLVERFSFILRQFAQDEFKQRFQILELRDESTLSGDAEILGQIDLSARRHCLGRCHCHAKRSGLSDRPQQSPLNRSYDHSIIVVESDQQG
jgi:hypothetical protein